MRRSIQPQQHVQLIDLGTSGDDALENIGQWCRGSMSCGFAELMSEARMAQSGRRLHCRRTNSSSFPGVSA